MRDPQASGRSGRNPEAQASSSKAMSSSRSSTRQKSLLRASLSALLLLEGASAFYLPGSAPRSFAQGDSVPLLVNALSPQIASKKQLQSLLSYDYYNPQFHFCRPGDGQREPKTVSESLGSVLFGDRLYESPFDVRRRRTLKHAEWR